MEWSQCDDLENIAGYFIYQSVFFFGYVCLRFTLFTWFFITSHERSATLSSGLHFVGACVWCQCVLVGRITVEWSIVISKFCVWIMLSSLSLYPAQLPLLPFYEVWHSPRHVRCSSVSWSKNTTVLFTGPFSCFCFGFIMMQICCETLSCFELSGCGFRWYNPKWIFKRGSMSPSG